jgi:hypothetical protein
LQLTASFFLKNLLLNQGCILKSRKYVFYPWKKSRSDNLKWQLSTTGIKSVIFGANTQIYQPWFYITYCIPLTNQQEHQGNDPRNLHFVLDPAFLEVQTMDRLDIPWKSKFDLMKYTATICYHW